jgi:hypothetical protein
MRSLTAAMLCSFLSLSIAAAHLGAQVRYVLLPARAVNGIVGHQGTWVPTERDIAELEAGLSQISNLQIEGWTPALHIQHPENYYRQ